MTPSGPQSPPHIPQAMGALCERKKRKENIWDAYTQVTSGPSTAGNKSIWRKVNTDGSCPQHQSDVWWRAVRVCAGTRTVSAWVTQRSCVTWGDVPSRTRSSKSDHIWSLRYEGPSSPFRLPPTPHPPPTCHALLQVHPGDVPPGQISK